MKKRLGPNHNKMQENVNLMHVSDEVLFVVTRTSEIRYILAIWIIPLRNWLINAFLIHPTMLIKINLIILPAYETSLVNCAPHIIYNPVVILKEGGALIVVSNKITSTLKMMFVTCFPLHYHIMIYYIMFGCLISWIYDYFACMFT